MKIFNILFILIFTSVNIEKINYARADDSTSPTEIEINNKYFYIKKDNKLNKLISVTDCDNFSSVYDKNNDCDKKNHRSKNMQWQKESKPTVVLREPAYSMYSRPGLAERRRHADPYSTNDYDNSRGVELHFGY